MMSVVRLLLLSVAALALVAPIPLLAAMQPAPSPASDEDSGCAAPKGPEGLPVVDDPLALDDRLASLYGLYEGLPGFVDVHFRPQGETAFTALFLQHIPAEAHAVETPVPVALQALPDAPVVRPNPLAAGLVPGTGPTAPTAGEAISPADLVCPGIRPGARIVANNAACTLAFLFTDGNKVYASTAGHCVEKGDVPSIDRGGAIGTTVYSTGDGGVGKDFALIEIASSKHHLVDPAMCDYGGPERMNGGAILGKVVLHTGHGAGVIGDVPPRPKQGVGGSWGHTSFAWFGTAIPGDSGSAVETSDGAAIGVLTHGGASLFGNDFGTRLDTALGNAGYGHLTLMTAEMEF